ncbi:MAG: NAD-dependent epimerase/dehydratase family protein [Labilithrix sp.]|nr:NAD-dependent epimerase/dehydratase family protein [Labilithrix sp.]
MKALVTGAAGFIGSNVVRALLDAGHEVRAFHLPNERLTNLRRLDVERFAGDVTRLSDVRAAARGCEVVFHLAAIYALWTRDEAHMHRVNVEGTRNVLEAARAEGVRRVVHTSSIARFGGQGPSARATEESAFALGATGDAYSRSKAAAHEVAVQAAREQDVVIVAPCGPLGPGDAAPTPTGRLLLTTVKMPVVVVADTATNFADVRDMARAHVLAAEKGKRGETYLLGCRDLSMVEVAKMALEAVGAPNKRVVVAPFAAARAAARGMRFVADRVTKRPPLFTPAAVRIARLGLRADCSKAVRELGMPQSPLENAVSDAMAWFGREGYLS